MGSLLKRLDADVSEIRMLSRGLGDAAWLLAKKIDEIAVTRRWTLRKTAGGDPKYRSFGEFIFAECEISEYYARVLRRTYARFTRADFENIGPSKLLLILRLPAAEQDALLRSLRKRPMSQRELKGRVATSRGRGALTDDAHEVRFMAKSPYARAWSAFLRLTPSEQAALLREGAAHLKTRIRRVV